MWYIVWEEQEEDEETTTMKDKIIENQISVGFVRRTKGKIMLE